MFLMVGMALKSDSKDEERLLIHAQKTLRSAFLDISLVPA
jgi:hypothetical protein